MGSPFIDTADVVNYLGRGGTADAGIEFAVEAACDVCRALTEQSFTQTAGATVVLDGTGTDALLLPEKPVASAGTVTVDGGTITDFVLDANGVLIRKADSDTDWSCFPTLVWPKGRQNVEVTYDHGYADADLPSDIRMVALSIASRLIVQGVASFEVQGQNQIRYAVNPTDLSNGEKAILRKYRG